MGMRTMSRSNEQGRDATIATVNGLADAADGGGCVPQVETRITSGP